MSHVSSSSADNSSRPVSRVSDAEREAVAERLRAAAVDGRLELAELDGRIDATYSAKTSAELEKVTADLSDVVEADRPLRLETTSGSRAKTGRWVVPSQITASCTSGSIRFDFTEAICPHRSVTMNISAKSGSIKLVVPLGWGVNFDDVTVASGSVHTKVPELPDPGKPQIVVQGQTRSGSVIARYRRRTFWQWLLRRPHTR